MKEIEVNFSRSKLVESRHKVKILVTNTDNKILLSSGNNNDFIYPRSSIKIFQAIPFIRSNAVERYSLNSKNIALACSSHRGEKFHINELSNWKNKIGINLNNLKCGIHNPLNIKASEELFRSNNISNELYNNCAGKHLAMLSSCKMYKYDINSYLNFNHPHQREIRKIFEIFGSVKIKKSNFGIDGCSAPQYSFKISDINKMLNNLNRSFNEKFDFHFETKSLISSILSNPKYIGGTDSFDSKLMQIANKDIFCKGGAEGVFLFTNLKKGISGVIKVIDGNERAIPYAIYTLFKKFKIMEKNQLIKLSKLYDNRLFNHAKINIGNVSTIL